MKQRSGSDLAPDEIRRERRALELLDDLLNLAPEARAARLESLRATDGTVHATVVRLLDAHDRLDVGGGIFDAPATAFVEPIVRSIAAAAEDTGALITAVTAATKHRYVIQHEIGRGGHAVVYRAHDVAHDRDVAIKAMRRQNAMDEGSQRFLREIGIIARLQHPYVIPLLDSGSADGSLYFVMPLIEGDTLRQRIAAGGALSIPATLAVLGDIAEALDYAHTSGVVHRDITPSNIMLREGHALLTDFGVALATLADAAPRVTDDGIAVGTPYYMSPEQTTASLTVDRRTDVYALACVCFEMLTGEVPYPGTSVSAVQARVLHAPIPDPRVLRPSLSEAASRVLARGMAKLPVDRFDSAGEFVCELRRAVQDTGQPVAVHIAGVRDARIDRWRFGTTQRRGALVGLVMLAGAAIVVAMTRRDTNAGAAPSAPSAATSDAIVLLPFEHRGDAAADQAEDRLLRVAFRRWRGLSLVDPRRVDEALRANARSPLTLASAAEVTRAAGASRFVWGTISGNAGRLVVNATLYDATASQALAEYSAPLPVDGHGADSIYAALADALLFGDLRAPEISVEPVRSTDYRAHREFLAAHEALSLWDLSRAEELLVSATNREPAFVNGWLWLALVRRWSGQPTPRWSGAALMASRGGSELSHRDSVLAAAMLALSRDDIDTACRLIEPLSVRYPTDFPSWFAAADCTSKDHWLVRDARSPSGWRFRRSPYHAMLAYRRAFQLLPSAPIGLRPNGFDKVRRFLQGSANVLIAGRPLPPDSGLFLAAPSMDGDTIRYVPLSLAAMNAEGNVAFGRASPRGAEAARRQRELFHELATAWVARYPRNSPALEALGLSLQLLGEAGAQDTLRRARMLALTPDDKLRAYITSAMVELHLAIPSDRDGIARARALADSALTLGARGNIELASLASLAAFTGRVTIAAELASRQPRDPRHDIAPLLWQASQEQLTYAAMAVRSRRAYDMMARLDSLIAESPVEQRESWRAQTTERAALVLLPVFAAELLPRFASVNDPLFTAARSLVRGDTLAARKTLADAARGREFVPPSDWTFDVLLPEAWLLEQAGDPAAAARTLDRALNAQTISTSGLASHVQAGALVQAMAARARLAERLGDRRTAVRWAAAVATLLQSADVEMQPLRAEMGGLMSDSARGSRVGDKGTRGKQ